MSSPMVSCQDLSISFGVKELFKNLSFVVSEGDRLGLIGINGAGKSTLLKLLAGHIEPDQGAVIRRQRLKICYLTQIEPIDPSLTVLDYLERSLDSFGHFSPTEVEKKKSQFQTLTDLENQTFSVLSGGQSKRARLASQYLCEPDLWILDEPTNHLDFAAVLWLQDLLKRSLATYLLVSHDRFFLDQVVKDTVELSTLYEDGYIRFAGGYSQFIEQKTAFLEACHTEAQSLANKLRKESDWASRQPKARTTKARFRLDRVDELDQQLAALRQRMAVKKLDYGFSSSERRTKRLIELSDLAVGYDKPLISGLNLVLAPGTIIGIIGPNGSGKSTLLGAIHRDLHILNGSISRAHGLEIAYMSQKRESLNDDDTLKTALEPDSDGVLYQDKTIHINAWASMLGFDKDRLSTKVANLSGGERARVLMSHMIRQKADVLLLDEPTNDLDIMALDVLEQGLLSFSGAVVLITHDRYLLNKLCDGVIGFLGHQQGFFYSDFNQWQKDFLKPHKESKHSLPADKSTSDDQRKMPREQKSSKGRRLSYKDQREYDGMEDQIAQVEQSLATQQQSIDQLAASDPEQVKAAYQQLHLLQEQLDLLYQRWADLEALSST